MLSEKPEVSHLIAKSIRLITELNENIVALSGFIEGSPVDPVLLQSWKGEYHYRKINRNHEASTFNVDEVVAKKLAGDAKAVSDCLNAFKLVNIAVKDLNNLTTDEAKAGDKQDT